MPAVTPCPNQDLLRQFAHKRLAAPATKWMREHLKHCDACCQQLNHLSTHETVAEMLGVKAAPEESAKKEEAENRSGPRQDTTAERPVASDASDSTNIFALLSPPKKQDEIGRLGSYRILQLLGKGGMGAVFVAEDPKLARKVAIKVMLPECARKKAAKDRFIREARAAASLDSDHVVSIYQVDEENGVPYFPMPLLKGMSLEDYLKAAKQSKTQLSWPQIVRVGREIAMGLSAAHRANLVHRDVKPSNIWLEANSGGRVKILDFGLAVSPDVDEHLTTPGMVVGTAAYMAPEQARGEKPTDRSDLYSLGCVLYRLSTGQLPFHGTDKISTILQASTEVPVSPAARNPNVPPALSFLILKLLEKRPEDRHESAYAVATELQRIEQSLSPRPDALPIAVVVAAAKPLLPDVGADPLSETLTSALPLLRPYTEPAVWSRFRRTIASICAAAIGVVAVGCIWFFATDRGKLRVESFVPDASLNVERGGRNVASLGASGSQDVELPTGEYSLSLSGNVKNAFLVNSKVVVARGGIHSVTIHRKEVRVASVLEIDNPQPEKPSIAVIRGNKVLQLLDLKESATIELPPGAYSLRIEGNPKELSIRPDRIVIHDGQRITCRIGRVTDVEKKVWFPATAQLPAADTDEERKAAQWMIDKFGEASVELVDVKGDLLTTAKGQLPEQPFVIRGVLVSHFGGKKSKQFTAEDMAAISKCRRLEHLNLLGNKAVTDDIVGFLSEISTLRYCNLSSTSIGNGISEFINRQRRLDQLIIYSTNVDFAFFRALKPNQALVVLNFPAPRDPSAIVAELIRSAPRLKLLAFSGGSVESLGPIHQFVDLNTVALRCESLTPVLCQSLENVRRLKSLNVDGPASAEHLKHLHHLDGKVDALRINFAGVSQPGITLQDAKTLVSAINLKSIAILGSGGSLSQDALMHLVEMPTLRDLSLTFQGAEEAIGATADAFRAKRPEVKLTIGR